MTVVNETDLGRIQLEAKTFLITAVLGALYLLAF